MNIDQELKEVYIIISKKEEFKTEKQNLISDYDKINQLYTNSQIKLNDAKKRVKKLQSFSLINLWYSFIGRKVEKLNTLKNKLFDIEDEFKNISTQFKNKEDELNDINNKLLNIENNQSKYNSLLKQKENDLVEQEDSIQLREYITTIKNLKNSNQDLNDSIIIAKTLLSKMKEMMKSLRSASGWGTYDVFGGNGILTHLSKYEHIDEAKSKIDGINDYAKKLSKKLNNANLNFDINVNISKGMKFSDWFFNSIIFDLDVQSEIKETINNLEVYISQVKYLILKLDNQKNKNHKEIEALQRKKEEFIINSIGK